jgi:hypothetical protein
MPYQPTIHGPWDGYFPCFAIFPIRDANLFEIENQFILLVGMTSSE